MKKLSCSEYFEACCGEPFRIFFPLGLLAGVLGVSLWPLYFSGLHKFYPGIMHARLMVEGFLGAFVFGFLGTAGPRLTSAPPFSPRELKSLLALYFATVGLQIAERPFAGDVAFLVLLAVFLGLLGKRVARRGDVPPPSFVLVPIGFLNALTGTVCLLAGQSGLGSPRLVVLGSSLLNQGWLLLLVIGVGSFLLPRFLQLPDLMKFPESPIPSPRWKKLALANIACGLFFSATFLLDAFSDLTRTTGLVRGIAAVLFLYAWIPVHRTPVPRLTVTICIRAALLFLVLGLLFPAFWPGQRVAGMHVVLIGCFSLVTLTIGTRVVLGHSGFGFLFKTPLPFLAVTALLLAVAMALRVAGDFLPTVRGQWLSGAAYAWMLGAAVWGLRALPKVRISEAE